MKLIRLNLSSLLLFIALVCFSWVIFLIWLRFTSVSLSFSIPTITTSQGVVSTDSGEQSLSIPELGINLKLITAEVSKNHWPVSRTGLIHVSRSPLPGDSGNSIIYGHNWHKLLGNLKNSQVGQIIEIKSKDSKVKKFIVEKVSIVSPQDAQLLNPTSVPTLTLYTCTGFLDTKRLVVTATLL